MRFHICLYKDNKEVININDVTSITWFGNFIQINTNFETPEMFNGEIYCYEEFDRFEVDRID